MSDTEFPDDALTDVETAVTEGEKVLSDDDFNYTGDSAHPNAVLRRSLSELEERLQGDGNEVQAVNVGDAGDPDGGAATAVLRHKFGGTAPDFESHPSPMQALYTQEHAGGLISLPASYRGYHPDPEDALEQALDVLEQYDATDIPVYFTDLGVNESNAEKMMELFNRKNPVRVRDHHTPLQEAVDAADQYVYADDMCAAQIVLRQDHPDAPDYLWEFVEGPIRVRDLWLDDHPKFEEWAIYGDAHFHLGDSAFERLAAAFGKEMINIPGLGEELEKRHAVKMAKIEHEVRTAEFHEVDCPAVDSGVVTVALARGDAYSSEVGRRLYSEGFDTPAADLVVIAKPSGNVSLRARDGFHVCDQVAKANGGGGHPPAAGFEAPVDSDMTLETKGKIALATVAKTLGNLDADDIPDE